MYVVLFGAYIIFFVHKIKSTVDSFGFPQISLLF